MKTSKIITLRDNISAVYNYTDEEDKLIYQCVRYKPKKFRQRRVLGENYIWGISAGHYKKGENGDYYKKSIYDSSSSSYEWLPALEKYYPYRVTKLLSSQFVVLAEGEKDVHTLEELGFVATTNSGGIAHFPKDLIPFFAEKYVAILSDNDETGRYGAYKRAKLLENTAKQIKVIPSLPKLELHEDITDWVTKSFKKYPYQLSGRQRRSAHNFIRGIIQKTTLWSSDSDNKLVTKVDDLPTSKKKINSIHEFLNLFRGVITHTSSHWLAHCPCHTDKVRSLSISLRDNKILIYCFAGCTTSTLLNTLNLSWEDLFIDD